MIWRVTRWVAALLVLLLLAALAAGIYLLHRVDRHWVAAQLEQSLSRKVQIGDMKVNLFSSLGSFVVKDVVVSRRFSPQRLAAMKSIPRDLRLLSAAEGSMRIRWLPLLRRHLEIDALVLKKPDLHIDRNRDGSTNLDDLLNPDPDEAPLLRSVHLSGLSIQDGRVTWNDRAGGARYSLENMVLNARRRKGSTDLGVTMAFGMKSQRMGRTALARNVDVDWRLHGSVHLGQPPKASLGFALAVDLPRGQVDGLTVLQRLRQLPGVADLLGSGITIPEAITWKDGAVTLSGKGQRLSMADGLIRTREYSLEYGGIWNLESDAIDLDLVFRFPAGQVPSLRRELTSRINTLVPSLLQKQVSPGELAEEVLSVLLDREGRPRLAVRVTGTLTDPRPQLVKPGFDSLRKAVAGMLRVRAKEQGLDLLEQLLE